MEKELPKNWVETSPKNISEIIRGVSYSKDDAFQEEFENSCLILRGGNVQDGNIVEGKDNVYVDCKYIKKEQLVRESDVLIVGSTGSKQLIGKAATIREDNELISFGAFLMILRAHKKINGWYFSYYFQTDFYRESIRNLAGGVNINNIRKEYIENLVFPLPPLTEQDRIVEKLDSLFAHLESIKTSMAKIPVLLKNFRQQVLTQAVTGKLTEEWRVGKEFENGEDFIKKIIEKRKLKSTKKANHPFVVDKSWSFGYLQYFGEFTRGKSKHRPRNDKKLFGGIYPFIQTGEVSRSKGLITNYTNTYSEFGLSQSRLFPKGTLCITIAANIAETGILDFDACFPDSVVGYLPFENLYSSKFAMFYLNTIQKDLEQFAPATAQKNINLGILFDVAFPVPPLKEQQEIVSRVERLFAKADAIEEKYKNLKAKIENLPQTILHKAFKGELTEQLESDGDARVLLEEIAALKNGEKPKKVVAKKYVQPDEKVLRIVAEPAAMDYHTKVEKTPDWYDQRFELWVSQQGLAARGTLDKATLRELFDAMDDEDK